MDGQRFDNWAKTLPTAGSRRAAIRLLAGGALSVGFARLGLRQAAAACGTPGNKCCKGKCNRGATCNSEGYCKCKAGWRRCKDNGGYCRKKDKCCGIGFLCENPCQETRCKNGVYQCVTTQPGTPCDEFCCQAPTSCCEGWRGCKPPDPDCGDCKILCGDDKCCALTQTCRRNADLSYECV